jgi:hypothetical protein
MMNPTPGTIDLHGSCQLRSGRAHTAALSLAVVVSACTPAGVAPAAMEPAEPEANAARELLPPAQGVEENCAAWASYQDGPYKYENNVWGSAKAQGKFEQCLLRRELAGKSQFGWKWSWPGFDKTVFAYPQIIFGWKPWSGGGSTDPRFPLRVDAIKTLKLHYSVKTQATGSYNLAPEIWLIGPGGKATTAANPSLITAEVMFWMDYKSGAQPAGRVIAKPVLDGVTYELWKADTIGDKGNGQGWALYSFKSPTIQHQGSISIDAMMHYLVAEKHVRADEQVASVEFGNEVMGGTGETWVERFDVEL